LELLLPEHEFPLSKCDVGRRSAILIVATWNLIHMVIQHQVAEFFKVIFFE
jgi:hypothetical protein